MRPEKPSPSKRRKKYDGTKSNFLLQILFSESKSNEEKTGKVPNKCARVWPNPLKQKKNAEYLWIFLWFVKANN